MLSNFSGIGVTSPLTSSGGDNPNLSIPQANSTTNGFLSLADWNSFNNKVSSQWTANGVKLFYNAGNAGIGTTNPQNKIDIAGNAVIGSSYSGINAAPANGLLVEGKIGVGTTSPATSAAFEVKSSNSGVLLPRMAFDQRNAIAGPAEGLMVFCTDCGTNGAFSVYSNGAWRTFTLCNTPPTTSVSNTQSPGQIIWKWSAVAGASGYKWNTTANYGSATDMATAITKTETGISCGTTCTRYVWVYNDCGISAPVTLSQTVPAAAPLSPTTAVHIASQTTVTWRWHPVAGATGYKWSATNDFSLATDIGTDTTKLETNLTCETVYTRYIWAYNGCSYSAPTTLTRLTQSCWLCGSSTITINHIAGAVAPVNKLTIYGTVTNIPGEPTKCWITSNLGSDHQATAVDDATEASAGWYWQFNLKQGYKHDGTTRTPNTSWTNNIFDPSDWITANDPCNIELGTTWHIPTYTEWYNVDNSGGWTTWTGPWASGLKLHAAGYLLTSSGSLGNRGTAGNYWSNTQNASSLGSYMYFLSVSSNVNSSSKAYGFSVRCVRDY
jgi:hypothetical protein